MTLNKRSRLAEAVIRRKTKAAFREARAGFLCEVLITSAFTVLVFMFVFGIHIQRGNDMYPAIKDGDVVLYYRPGRIVNTEAVVYDAGEDGLRIGRVVAQSGTEISAAGDLQMTFDGIFLPVSVNDGIYSRTYAAEQSGFPFTVDEECLYILCDNRDRTKDSREYGQINKRNIRGRIICVLRRRQI